MPGARALGDRECDAAGYRRHLDFGAQHGLIDGDRDVQHDIVPLPLELRMRTHLDLDQRIAGFPTGEGPPFPAKAQDLPVGHAFRHRQVEHTAVRQRHSLLRPASGFQEIDLQGIANILSAARKSAATRPALIEGRITEHVGENVGEAKPVARPAPAEWARRGPPAWLRYCGRRGSPVASISPRSNCLRLSGSPMMSLAAATFLNRSVGADCRD